MYKVRFNLQHGEHFQKWQIKKDEKITYYVPDLHSFIMYECVLRNNLSIAKRIYSGEDKRVCAWIECKHIVVYDYKFNPGAYYVRYNPRWNIHWDVDGTNVDNKNFYMLTTSGDKVYTRFK